MSFRDIKGQDNAVSFLKKALESGRVAHAYIFLGPSGVGKKLAALNFAKALNCLGESEKPCDSCASCKKIESSNHPDVHLLNPLKEGGSIKIDEARTLILKIGLKPYEGRKKVCIIDGANALTQEATSSLLKTLEEPPADSVLILILDKISYIPRTIQSRSQIIRFRNLAADEIKNILVEKHGVDAVKAHILARISSGRLGEAIKYKDEEFFEKRAELLDGLSKRTFFDSDFEGAGRDDFKLYLDMMLSWYRDILVAKVSGGAGQEFFNIDRRDDIYKEAAGASVEHLNEIIGEIIATGSYLESNANAKLAMSVLGLKILADS